MEEKDKPKKIKPPKRDTRNFLDRSIYRWRLLQKNQNLEILKHNVNELYSDLKIISENNDSKEKLQRDKFQIFGKELLLLEKILSNKFAPHKAYNIKQLNYIPSSIISNEMNVIAQLAQCKEIYISLMKDVSALKNKTVLNGFKMRKFPEQDIEEFFDFTMDSKKQKPRI